MLFLGQLLMDGDPSEPDDHYLVEGSIKPGDRGFCSRGSLFPVGWTSDSCNRISAVCFDPRLPCQARRALGKTGIQACMNYMQRTPSWIPDFFPNHSSKLEGDQNEHYH